MPGVIEYLANFTIGENHTSATFEAVTGYMKKDFNGFWVYNLSTRTLAPLKTNDSKKVGKGQEPYIISGVVYKGQDPVILATKDGNYAMGVYSPQVIHSNASYNAWNFGNTTKWNCFFKVGRVTTGQTYRYRCYPIVGSLKDVTDSMDELYARNSLA
jgi:hypothetical protein